ncbi:hypothetical protein TNCT_666801 [Trichonephila clavata]|uniref:Uncharacterized protein n=1 Tax=Trichonephila clavata TaxID=2740835 RepID=A0A8X6LGW9_TRICU|nr:hypothetical protein TNCT_666801 [Trichonephila clavata]
MQIWALLPSAASPSTLEHEKCPPNARLSGSHKINRHVIRPGTHYAGRMGRYGNGAWYFGYVGFGMRAACVSVT